MSAVGSCKIWWEKLAGGSQGAGQAGAAVTGAAGALGLCPAARAHHRGEARAVGRLELQCRSREGGDQVGISASKAFLVGQPHPCLLAWSIRTSHSAYFSADEHVLGSIHCRRVMERNPVRKTGRGAADQQVHCCKATCCLGCTAFVARDGRQPGSSG